MKKIIALFVWFLKFAVGKPRDEYNMHDYIRDRFCPEFIPVEEFDEKEQLLRDTPGPAGIKYAYYVGNKVGGVLGAAAAISALLVPAVAVALAFSFAYEPIMSIRVLNVYVAQRVFNGMHAAALGIVIAHIYKIIYFNHVKRKGLIFILPSAFVFVFFAAVARESEGLYEIVLTPFYILAVIGLGIAFGLINDTYVRYRKKHPKYIDPYGKKAKKMRERQLREEEYELMGYIDDNTIKRRRQQLEDERLQQLKDESAVKIRKGEE